jgi:hypothetical protein
MGAELNEGVVFGEKNPSRGRHLSSFNFHYGIARLGQLP